MFLGIGYNADVDSVPFEKLLIDMANSGSKTHLIMCNPPNGIPTNKELTKLWEIYNYLKPIVGNDLTLIWRFYNRYEGDFLKYDSKIIQAILSKMQLPPNTIIDSLCNEPNLNNGSYLTAENYVRHELNILRDLKAIGVKYAVGAFSTGTPNETLIEKGLFDSLLKEAEYFSIHLYGVFPFEAGETLPYNIMSQKTDFNRETIRNIYFNKTKWPKEYKGWLFGRLGFWESRCKKLNIKMPKVFITESFLDYIDAVPPNIMNEWKQNFGVAEFQNTPIGLKTWFNHLTWAFPDLTFQQTIKMLLLHIVENIFYDKSYIQGIHLFGYNRNWSKRGHNIEDTEFNSFRNKHLKEVNMTVIKNTVENNNKHDLIWSNSVTNVRTQPKIQADNISWFLTNEKVSVTILERGISGIENNYKWVKFLRHSDNEIFYVAETANLNVVDVENDEPNYIVDLLGMSQVFTKSELQDVLELMQEFRDFVDEAKQESDVDDKEYMRELFDSFIELLDDADDVNVQKTLGFLDRIITGIKEAQVF